MVGGLDHDPQLHRHLGAGPHLVEDGPARPQRQRLDHRTAAAVVEDRHQLGVEGVGAHPPGVGVGGLPRDVDGVLVVRIARHGQVAHLAGAQARPRGAVRVVGIEQVAAREPGLAQHKQSQQEAQDGSERKGSQFHGAAPGGSTGGGNVPALLLLN